MPENTQPTAPAVSEAASELIHAIRSSVDYNEALDKARPIITRLLAARDGDITRHKAALKVATDALGLINRMSVDQSREDNKASFVRRLTGAGWPRKEAEAEYERETA